MAISAQPKHRQQRDTHNFYANNKTTMRIDKRKKRTQLPQIGDEDARGAHRADGVRRRRADADAEQIERADHGVRGLARGITRFALIKMMIIGICGIRAHRRGSGTPWPRCRRPRNQRHPEPSQHAVLYFVYAKHIRQQRLRPTFDLHFLFCTCICMS